MLNWGGIYGMIVYLHTQFVDAALGMEEAEAKTLPCGTGNRTESKAGP